MIDSRSECVALPVARNADVAPGTVVLEVIDGLHDGVRVALNGTDCRIGTDSGCDVVLADGNIAPDHARIRFYGKQLAVDATGGDVAIDGQPLLPRGQGRRMDMPAVLTVGEARLRIGRSDSAFGLSCLDLLERIPTGVMIGAGVVIIAIVGFAASRLGVHDAHAATGHTEPPAIVTQQQPVPPAPDAVSDALRQRLMDGGLLGLAVEQAGRHLNVSGTLGPENAAEWQAAQQWFDGTYGTDYVLTSHVMPVAANSAPDFAFRAVWFGPSPYVVDAQGQRRYPGAALRDGWLLRAIEPDRVILSRNGADFELTLGADAVHANAGSGTNR